MKIETISYRDFKGLSGTLDLTKPTLLTGPNGSGKSARMLGPQFAVTGRSPLGARLEDSIKLAGPVGCQVAVRCEGGPAWSRELRFDPTSKGLSMALKIVGQEQMGLKASERHLAGEVGDFAPMFDLRSFLDLSSDKRRAFVLDLCSRACGMDKDQDDVLAKRALLIEIFKVEIGEGTVREYLSDGVVELAGLWMKLGEDKAVCLEAILERVKIAVDCDPATAISDALQTATDMLNASKTTRDHAHQAARKLSEQKATIEVTAGSIGELKEKRGKLTNELGEIAKQIANQAGRADAREAIQRAIQDWTTRLAENQRVLESLEKTAAADTKRKTELEENLRSIPIMAAPPEPPDLTQRFKACEIAQADKFAADEALRDVKHSAQMCEGTIQSLAVEIAEFAKSPWHKALELFDLLSKTVPLPAKWVKEWRALGDLIRKHTAVDHVHTLKLELTTARAALEFATAEIVTATEKQTEAIDALDVATAHWKADQTEAAVAADTARVSREAQATAQKELFEITLRESELARLKTEGKGLRIQQAGNERRLNELDAAGGHVPIEELEGQQSNLDHLQAEVDLELEAKERYQVLDTELMRCVASAEHEALLHETCKSVCAAIRTMRERLMERLVSPLLERVNAFLAIAEPECRAYCELLNPRGRPIFELGWIRKQKSGMEQRVPLPALSGGETAIFGAALAFALVGLSQSPLKLLLLEAGEVDGSHLVGILKALGKLRGDLSNIMVATHLRLSFHTGGWNTVDLW